MQKPFKRQPAFDEMLASVLERDPNGRLLLHDVDSSAEARRTALSRLEAAGCDMRRVHLIPELPHHRLLALYTHAEVVLDSYPASGCTTTREALEVGALVVTLPAQYLGSRWTLAFYSIIGVTDLVASSTEDYVRIAVEMGTDVGARERMRSRISANLHKMYQRQEAIEAWIQTLLRIAGWPEDGGMILGYLAPLSRGIRVEPH